MLNAKAKLVGIVVKAKNSGVVRHVAKPFVERKRERALNEYLKSDDAKKLRSMKGRFQGRRCFIIGNGPSLNISDLEKISSEYSFAANGIYKLFGKTEWRPTFYTCVDTASFQMYGDILASLDVPYKFFDVSGKKYLHDTGGVNEVTFLFQTYPFKIHRWEYEEPAVSEDVSSGVTLGYTVTFTAIQLAMYMGFTELILIGVDHSYSKRVDSSGCVVEDKSKESYSSAIGDSGLGIQYTDITTAAYRSARDHAASNGVRIVNATRGGELEVFERVNFDALMTGDRS